MIKSIIVQNYKSIGNVNVDLEPLTVFVGRNGAGKSTFIDVFRLIRDALQYNMETAIDKRGGIERLRRWSPISHYSEMHISLGIMDLYLQASYDFTVKSNKDNFKVSREYIDINIDMAELLVKKDDDIKNISFDFRNGKLIGQTRLDRYLYNNISDDRSLRFNSVCPYVAGGPTLTQYLISPCFYSVFPNTLRLPQTPSSDKVLNDDGSNLGAVLRHLIKTDEYKHDLVASMNRLVGDIEDIRVKSTGGYLITELKHKSSSKKDKWFNLSQESDGTLRMLGLLVALYQDEIPSLIAIEEPELTIHAGALSVLSDVIKEAATRTQIIITTQSPDLLSRFGTDQIRVVERVDGVTEIGKIDETQRAAIENHLFTSGELLRMEGLYRETVAGAEHA